MLKIRKNLKEEKQIEDEDLTIKTLTELKELAKKLNLKEDEVMIFGDQTNDISMFDVPGFYEVAMGNAVSEIKKRANFITKTNNEDGIAYALRRLVFNE